jgi:hypothetical protein
MWNPGAAASWSLIFSPAFGAFLQMRNWRALDQAARKSKAKAWFIASLVMLVVYVVIALSLPNPKAADGIARSLGFVYLLVWYFAEGRSQMKYVKDRFHNDYPRKGWGAPLGIAALALIGYVVLAGVTGYLIAAARH